MDEGQVLTTYLICRGEYAEDPKGCRSDYRKNVSDNQPGVVMWGEKVYSLIGGNHGGNAKRRLSVLVPATSVVPITSEATKLNPNAAPVTWQDIKLLNQADAKYLLTAVMPEAVRLYKAHGASKQYINRLDIVVISHDKWGSIT